MHLRILLLAPLDEPLTANARDDAAAAAYELACGLAACAADTEELAVDLVARRGTHTPLPLVSVDPSELEPVQGRVADEALLTQVALAGLTEGYHVVHALLPVVSVLQIAAAQGAAIVSTVADGTSSVLEKVIDPRRLALVRDIPPGVDLTRFRPAESPTRDYVVGVGDSARSIAAELGRPFRSLDGDILPLLQHAYAFVDDGRETVWPLRALACGTAVIRDASEAVDNDEAAVAGRRALALARHSVRAMVGRYREVYRELTSGE